MLQKQLKHKLPITETTDRIAMNAARTWQHSHGVLGSKSNKLIAGLQIQALHVQKDATNFRISESTREEAFLVTSSVPFAVERAGVGVNPSRELYRRVPGWTPVMHLVLQSRFVIVGFAWLQISWDQQHEPLDFRPACTSLCRVQDTPW